jgi:hypothetical protein
MEIVTSSGDVVTASRGDTDFDGLVAGLGALGAGHAPHPRRRARLGDLFGAPAATVDRHPILGLDAVNCTLQLGRPARGRTACRTRVLGTG